jgi:hypothetical protein
VKKLDGNCVPSGSKLHLFAAAISPDFMRSTIAVGLEPQSISSEKFLHFLGRIYQFTISFFAATGCCLPVNYVNKLLPSDHN